MENNLNENSENNTNGENQSSGQPKKKSSKASKIIIGLLVLLLIGAGVFIAIQYFGKEEPKDEGRGYDASVITDDDGSLQDQVDAMVEKAKEGQTALKMKTTAMSKNGEDFSCYICNSEANSYDMYLELFLKDTDKEPIYTSGVIPIGGRIEKFKVDKKLEKGSYKATLYFVQVKEDLVTEHSRVAVELVLEVE